MFLSTAAKSLEDGRRNSSSGDIAKSWAKAFPANFYLHSSHRNPHAPKIPQGFPGLAVEISSALKHGLLERPSAGKIKPTDIIRRIIEPQTPTDRVDAFREVVLKAPLIDVRHPQENFLIYATHFTVFVRMPPFPLILRGLS